MLTITRVKNLIFEIVFLELLKKYLDLSSRILTSPCTLHKDVHLARVKTLMSVSQSEFWRTSPSIFLIAQGILSQILNF
jgi:hypothetical protein